MTALEQQEKNNKKNRWQEIETSNTNQYKQSRKQRVVSLKETTRKTSLVKLLEIWREKFPINKIGDDNGNITTDTQEIKDF